MANKIPKAPGVKPAPKAKPVRPVPPVAQAAPAIDPNLRTVEGHPIPDHLLHLVPFELTDQGRAARPGVDRACARVTSGPFDKGLQRMTEDESYFDSDPIKEALAPLQAEHPELTFRVLSPRTCAKRGLRGWQPYLDAEGNQVKVADMFIGSMPKTKAARRSARFREMGNEALRESAEQYSAAQDKIIRDSGRTGLSVLPLNEVISDSRDPERAAQTGVHLNRGL